MLQNLLHTSQHWPSHQHQALPTDSWPYPLSENRDETSIGVTWSTCWSSSRWHHYWKFRFPKLLMSGVHRSHTPGRKCPLPNRDWTHVMFHIMSHKYSTLNNGTTCLKMLFLLTLFIQILIKKWKQVLISLYLLMSLICAEHVARGEENNVLKMSTCKPPEKRPLGRPVCRWENNNRIDLWKNRCQYDYLDSRLCRVQC